MKKLITAILCVVLCLGLVVPALGANSQGVTFKAELDVESLNVSETDQTVTLSISGDPTFTTNGFAYTVEYPAGFVPGTVTSKDFSISQDGDVTITPNDTIPDQYTVRLGWMDDNLVEHTGVSDLCSIPFTVPGNTAAGTYTFKIKDLEVYTGYGEAWESGDEFTVTLTIKDSGPVASTGAKLDKETASVTAGGTITLTPSLLPEGAEGTAATVSSVTWESSNPTIASVVGNADNTATVSGEAEGGPVTITARVTPSDSTTVYIATCVVTVTKSPYTIALELDGSDRVHPGETVTLNVNVSGAAYAGLEATVTYNKDLFTYDKDSNTISGATVTGNAGSVRINYVGDEVAASTATTLTFTAQTPDGDSATGTFDFSYAKASGETSAVTGTGPSAQGNPITVTVVNQYTVKFMDKDNSQIGSDIKVDAGSKLTDVPEAPVVENYDFTGWSDGKNTYADATAVKAVTISADTTFTATYTEKSYAVTLQSGLTGVDTATYNTPYTVTVADYDSDYVYTVTYTAEGGEEKTAADSGNGTFTIPGADITGALNVTFTKKLNATVSVHPDYVSGYTLITIASSGTKVYSYDGNTMFFISGQSEYAWLVAGSVTQDVAAGKIGEATTAATSITLSNDVNGDGIVDIDDAVVVNGVLNKRYDLSTYMAIYLRANVNAYDSYKVDAADINAIITDNAYEK